MLSPELLESTTLVVAGEACPSELVDQWATNGRVMINAYGPTEATIYAAMSGPLTAGSTVVPIGSPVPGAALFVLDKLLRPVSAGVVGRRLGIVTEIRLPCLPGRRLRRPCRRSVRICPASARVATHRTGGGQPTATSQVRGRIWEP